VSGQQVAAVMMECTGVTDAVVFGVSLARYEGQAGMAVISENSDFNLETLWDHVHRALPGYARPMLLRRRASIERTSTFKLRSSESKAEGYRDVPPDELWFDLPEVQRYVPLSQELMSMLEAGELRL
jgi:fatty-acyl-CoA synthase